MGFSKKNQFDESFEGKKWVIAGVTMRTPLKCLSTRKVKEDDDDDDDGGGGGGGYSNSGDSGSTTPTSKDSRIPEMLRCPPPPPRKRRPVSTCHHRGNREFFTSPDLDSLFKFISKAN